VAVTLFPAETRAEVETRLNSYINEAVFYKTSPSDESTKAWAYHRAFFAIYVRITGDPHTVDAADEGGHKYDKEQAERFKNLSDHFLEEWNVAVEAAPLNIAPPSVGIPTRFVW
jgi:hypothetical protein